MCVHVHVQSFLSASPLPPFFLSSLCCKGLSLKSVLWFFNLVSSLSREDTTYCTIKTAIISSNASEGEATNLCISTSSLLMQCYISAQNSASRLFVPQQRILRKFGSFAQLRVDGNTQTPIFTVYNQCKVDRFLLSALSVLQSFEELCIIIITSSCWSRYVFFI